MSLTALQRRVLALALRLPEGEGFMAVDALAQRLGRERLLELAAEKDLGLDRGIFAAQLGVVHALRPDEFRLSWDAYEAMRARMQGWREELEREGAD